MKSRSEECFTADEVQVTRTASRSGARSQHGYQSRSTNGPSRPQAARTMPSASTASVPTKFCQMVRRTRRATRSVSTKRTRSLSSSTTSALSRATSVPEPGITVISDAFDTAFFCIPEVTSRLPLGRAAYRTTSSSAERSTAARRPSNLAIAIFSSSVSPHCLHCKTGSALTITIDVSPILKGRSFVRPSHRRRLGISCYGPPCASDAAPLPRIRNVHRHHTKIISFEVSGYVGGN
jgi:hypothetical protein